MFSRNLAVAVFVCLGVIVAGTAVGVADESNPETVEGSPDITAHAAETAFVAEQEETLSVTLNNRGEISNRGNDGLEGDVTTAHEATAAVDDSEVPLTVRTGEQALGDIPRGTAGPIDFRVVPDADAEPGVYQVPIELEYRHQYRAEIDDGATIYDEQTVTETLEVAVEITDRARFEVAESTSDLEPGADGLVEVTLRNVGETAARDASVMVEPADPDLTFTTGSPTSESYADEWAPDESRTFTFAASLAQGAVQRPYTVGISVQFRDQLGAEATTRTLRTGVSADPSRRFADRAAFEVVDTDADLQAGADGSIEVSIQNVGGATAESASVTVEPADPDLTFTTDSPTSQSYAGEWIRGETRTFRFAATVTEDALPRPHALDITVNFRDESGAGAQTRTLRTGVNSDRQQVFTGAGWDSTLRVSGDGSFEAAIRNNGPRNVSNAIILFSNEAPAAEGVAEEPVPTDPNVVPRDVQATVGSIPVGETVTATFEAGIRADALPGDRTLNVAVRYRDSNGNIRVSDPVDVVVPVAPEQDTFSVETIDTTAERGGETTYEVQITNTGDERVESVEAKLFANDPIDPTDDEAFIPALDAGESTTVAFTVDVAGSANPRAYSASMDFRYDDADGDSQLSETYRVPVEVIEPDGGTGIMTLVGLIGVALVGVGLVARFTSGFDWLTRRLRRLRDDGRSEE